MSPWSTLGLAAWLTAGAVSLGLGAAALSSRCRVRPKRSQRHREGCPAKLNGGLPRAFECAPTARSALIHRSGSGILLKPLIRTDVGAVVTRSVICNAAQPRARLIRSAPASVNSSSSSKTSTPAVSARGRVSGWGLDQRTVLKIDLLRPSFARALGADTLGIVGELRYGDSDAPIKIDDRTLAHLQAVVVAKLRRHECFTVSWRHDSQSAPGRSTIWVHPAIPLRFVFDDGEPEHLNLEWLQRLMQSANSTGGIQLVEEPASGDWLLEGRNPE